MSAASATAMLPFLISLSKGLPLPVASAPDNITLMYEHDGDDDSFNVVQDVRNDAKYIPVLAIKNTIFKYDQQCGPRGTQSMMALMEEWKGNDNIMGVVLDFDSGGGQGAGTREFAKYILAYPKPVVAYSNGMICSAAYWLAAACRGGIIINENAEYIGSIGAMGKYVNMDGILTKEGAIIEEIYATQSPRKNEESRAMAKGNDALIKSNVLDPCAQYIIDDVKAFRPNVAEEVFEGAMYLPARVIELGLADKFGKLNDAFDTIISESKKTKTNNNQTQNNMSKTRAKVQAVLGLSAPLAATAENGSYLNEEQLDTFENELVAAEANAATLQASLDAATTAQATAVQALSDANTTHATATTEVEASVTAMLTGAGLTATGTITDKLTALNSHLAVVNKGDGAKHTNVPLGDGSKPDPATLNVVGDIDISAAMNN